MARSIQNDVWVLELGPDPDWQHVETIGESPSPRWGAAAVLDEAGDRMLVIGGNDGERGLSDLWELSLRNFRWRQIDPLGPAPPGRYGHTATFDPFSRRVLVFGGSLWDYWETNELWELDLSPGSGSRHSIGRPRWKQLAPAGTLPTPRSGHTMTADPVLGGLLLVGGGHSENTFTYICNMCRGTSDVWLLRTQGAPAWQPSPQVRGTPPCALQGHATFIDPVRRALVAYGASLDIDFSSDCFQKQAVSVLDLRTWEWTRHPTPAGMRARHFAGCGWDETSRQLLLFGGQRYQRHPDGDYSDTWSLTLADTAVWRRVVPEAASPTILMSAQAVHDAAHRRALWYDGQDLWSYSLETGVGWSRLPLVSGPLPLRFEHSVALDSRRSRLLIHGGRVGTNPYAMTSETIAIQLDSLTAITLPTGNGAPARSYAALLYDANNDRMLVFGGRGPNGDLRDVWSLSLDAFEWNQIVPMAGFLSLRESGSVVEDRARHRAIFFGGGTLGGDLGYASPLVETLPLDQEPEWTRLGPDSPEIRPRLGHAAVLDETDHRMLVIGGRSGGIVIGDISFEDLWSFDLVAERWERLLPDGPSPYPWVTPVAVMDRARNRVLTFERDATWALQLPEQTRTTRRALPANASLATSAALVIEKRTTTDGNIELELRVRAGVPAEVEILDVGGRRVFERRLEREVSSIDLRSEVENAGVYFVRLRQGAEIVTTKIVRLR